MSVLGEALDMVRRGGTRFYEVAPHRVKGELLLSRAQGLGSKVHEEAEACFYRALDVARRQCAKSLELRAVMSLCRLWQGQDKKEEARNLLSEIYGWFTEGSDTKDLQEAKALLAELV